MKKSFTFLIAFLLLATFAMAQNARVSITAPDGVAGNYVAQAAAFGPSACELSAAGMLMIGDDGEDPGSDACTPLMNDLTDRIAIIDRGVCNFSLKCYNAQAAGAVGVIVCNNVDEDIITMAAGDSSELIVIPCVMVSRQDCETFRVEAGNGLDGSISAVTVEDTSDDNVIWGDQPGQGDFNGGIGDWTVNNITCANGADVDMWTFSADGAVPGSCGGGQLTSPSNCNGAMGFSSDFLDSGNGDCGTGGGACGAPQIGELISPVIDLTNAGVPGVSLKWWQNSRQFTSTYIVSFTTDGGENWNDIPVNTEYVTNDPAVNEQRRVFLPGAVGNEIQVKFRYEANYYFWVVDDVQIVETEANNLQVDPFYAIPNNVVVPISQVEPVYFLADVRNIGSADQTNVNLNMTVTDETGSVVYTDDLSYGTIAAGTDVQNIPFNNGWTPDDVLGTYTGTYTISSDNEDFDNSNNVQSFNMQVSNTLFAKELGATRFLAPAEANWDEGAPKSWGMGNIFTITQGIYKDSLITASSATIGVSNRNAGLAGQSIEVWLYEWIDADSDGNVTDAERTRLGFGQLIFDGDGSGTPTFLEYDVPFFNFVSSNPEEAIILNEGSTYIVMMEYTDTDPAPDADIDFEIVAGDDLDYGAQIFLNSPATQDPDGNDLGLGVGLPRYAMALALPPDGSFASGPDFSTVGFGREIAPVVRLNLQLIPVSSTEQLSDDNILNVFPNPTSDKVNVQMDLVNVASKLNLSIYDTRGQEIMTQEYSNIQSDNLSFDVSKYAAGTYYIAITTEEGVKMKKFVVQR